MDWSGLKRNKKLVFLDWIRLDRTDSTLYRTNKDPEYLQDKNYETPIPIKINNLDDNNNLQNELIKAI